MKRLLSAIVVAMFATPGTADDTVKTVGEWLSELSRMEETVRQSDRETGRVAHGAAEAAILAIRSADLALRAYELDPTERNRIEVQISVKRAYAETTGFIDKAARRLGGVPD